MGRDTRLDEALERMEKVAASAFDTNDLMSDRVIARRVSDKRVFLAARRAIEGLFEEVAEERETYRRAWNRADEELVNLRAASLSVSPVRSERMIEEEREAAMKWVVGLMVLYGKENVREYTASEVQELVMNALASQPGRDSPAAPDRAQSVKPAHQEWEAVSPAPSDDAVWLSSIAAQHPAADSPVPEPSEPQSLSGTCPFCNHGIQCHKTIAGDLRFYDDDAGDLVPHSCPWLDGIHARASREGELK